MRPKSILLFEKLFLSATALITLNILYNYGHLRDYSLAQGGAAASSILGLILSVVMNLLFWFFIARRASNIAKWVMSALLLLGVIVFVASYRRMNEIGALYSLWSTVNMALQVAALAMLFRKDAANWLKRRGRTLDPGIFE